ncbi:MAG: penicillin-binding protein 2 [Dissulfurimicrobium hydrothermale]|uniref:penicillin-binding protein 2 n=1 Tax=Dissulfurimicrobium hydrothermale TaxID=1750598 RepID=UPI003C73E83B
MRLPPRTIFDIKQFDKDMNAFEGRYKRCTLLLLLVFMILISRLWYLQIYKGDELRAKSESNRLRVLRIQAPRGRVFDRNGRILTGVKPYFNVCIVREDVRDMEGLITRLAGLLGEDEADIRASLYQGSKQPLYMPIAIKRDIDWETLSKISARLIYLPGVVIDVAPGREYPYGPVAPHLIGYLGEISEDDIKNNLYPGARPGDMVGKSGVEGRYNSELAGVPGKRIVEVDVKGGLVKELEETPPEAGDDIYLTIDLDLQMAAEEAMKDKIGAAVVLDPNSGEILAMVSSPGFDPGIFAKGLTTEEWKALNDPLYRPLFNKAIQGTYAPGSTFKIVMAAAALEENVINENTTFFCPGFFKFGNRDYRCWKKEGHGSTNLYRALAESCDVYFYNVGLKLGIDKIAKYAKLFGLGEKTGIDLPNEAAGTIASSEWKKKRFKSKWYEGETLSISIGQGYNTVTPIQMARLIAAVANGGVLYRPNYIEKITGPDGTIEARFKKDQQGIIPVSESNLRLIQNGLIGVVEDDRGTAKVCRIKGITIAGKTGTAQVIRQAKRKEDEKMNWKYRDHAWFVAYAPAEAPKLAIAVLIEHGGHGGSAAAPVARAIIERWLQMQGPRPQDSPERTAGLDPAPAHQG